MQRDYSYSYEFDPVYCYPNSNVLRNNLGISDSEALHIAEREITAIRLAEAKVAPIEGHFDFVHLQKIHRHLFGDIYNWAGKLRSVNISKGTPFCNCTYLDDYANDIFDKLKAEKWLRDLELKPFIERLTFYFSEINILHPFREGNGRAQRLFAEYLAEQAGYHIDFSDVTNEEMVEASVLAFDLDYTKLEVLLERIVSMREE